MNRRCAKVSRGSRSSRSQYVVTYAWLPQEEWISAFGGLARGEKRTGATAASSFYIKGRATMKPVKLGLKKRLLASAVVCGAVTGLCNVTLAAETEEALEEIVVTGIRGSLMRS